MKWEIEKARCVEDFKQGITQPSDGGKYDKYTALSILENGSGGGMCNLKNANYEVSPIPEENDWLRKKLRIK
jgi:hypothetical protein